MNITVESIIKPKQPIPLKGWVKIPIPQHFSDYPTEAWANFAKGLRVISAVEVAEIERGAEPLGPQYHLSISMRGLNGKPTRCSSQDAQWVLKAFQLEDAEEDNHLPGIARHYWRPVADHLSGYQCPCKESELAIVEDKGDYIWRGTPG